MFLHSMEHTSLRSKECYDNLSLGGKYVITTDKFSLNKDNVLVFTIDSTYGDKLTINQYLPEVRRGLLLLLALAINVYKTDLKKMKTPELANYLNSKIEFLIPEEFLAYKKESILDTYIDFPQIYIPLVQQNGFKFCYKPNDDKWYTYPFTNRELKRNLVLLCEEIKIMKRTKANKYKLDELCELLNEKFVLQEQSG